MDTTDVIIIQLLNISLQLLELDFPEKVKKVFLNKLDIIRCMAIQALNLLKRIDETDRKERNKLMVSKMIKKYYQRFSLLNYHKTYNLTKLYQRKIVIVLLRKAYRCLSNTFYEFKNMHLNKIDDLNAGIINEIIYDEYTDMKILDEVKFIVEMNYNLFILV